MQEGKKLCSQGLIEMIIWEFDAFLFMQLNWILREMGFKPLSVLVFFFNYFLILFWNKSNIQIC